jgi:4,5-DOPA dioxygenase extradiol
MKLNELEHMTRHLKSTEPMPVLFLGHGSPMNAIEENEFTRGWE